MPKNINNIHDKFFKEVLANKQNAIDFLSIFLPLEISKFIDIQSTNHEKSSFVSSNLEEVFSDVILSCRLINSGDEIYITILLEHKSFAEENVSFQLLAYLSNGYAEQLKSKKKKRLIIPLIFYHGKKKWELKSLANHFSHYPLPFSVYIPNFETLFVDIQQLPDKQIWGIMNSFLSSALFLQKYSNNTELLIKHIHKLLSTFSSITNKNFLVTLFDYFLQVTELSENNLVELLQDSPDHLKNEFMSTYELIEKKGIEKGVEKGIEKEKENTVVSAFKNGISIELIANITNLPLEKIMEIINLNK